MTTQTLNRAPSPAVSTAAKVGRWQKVIAFFNSAPVAYLLLAAVILRVMWGMWDVRDLTYGDMTCYFNDAGIAFMRGQVDIAWSPLFAVVGALVKHISLDPYFYCISIRLGLVLTLAMMTLAISRRLLPAGVAWFVSAWWATLPINFNSLYEIHLFATVPYLATWWLLLGNNESRWRRGCALATMALATVLVRNEESVYFVLFAFACVAAEVWRRRSGDRSAGLLKTASPYIVPVALAACLIGVFYTRSYVQYPELAHLLRGKHTNNIGQIYCFGFQQRHPGVWTKSAWTDYQDLMTKTFGAGEVTLTEAIRANPPAMAEHFLWNASMIPSGIQFILFNRISSRITPDYISPPTDYTRATLLSALVSVILIAGLIAACKQRSEIVDWAKPRRWALTAMACYVPVAFFVMIMQRPRPSYVMAFGFMLMMMVGFSLWRIFAKTKLAGLSVAACPVLMLVAFFLSAPYYPKHAQGGRPALDYVRFLQPYSKMLADGERVLVPQHATEVSQYLYEGDGPDPNRMFPSALPFNEMKNGDFPAFLEKQKVGHVLIDRPWPTPPFFSQLETAKGWKLVAMQKLPKRTLMLFTKSKSIP